MEIQNTEIVQKGKIEICNYLPEDITDDKDEINEIIQGLTSKQKHISSKYFYDSTGSKLFEEITRLEEYYPTRTEKSILEQIAVQLLKTKKHIDIIELGSGDCSKISILFNSCPSENLETIRYMPVDVSASCIKESSNTLLEIFPEIKIKGMLADFMKHINQIPKNTKKMICFFGSTLGNLPKSESIKLLENIKNIMNSGDQFLLGLDMVKDIKVLENAYNDSKNVTAAFNKNILNVVNSLAGTNFNPDQFEHLAFYDEEKNRIEMHLKALNDMEIASDLFEEKIKINAGETIHTENSQKYTREDIAQFAKQTGLQVENIFTDTNKWFSLVQFEKVES